MCHVRDALRLLHVVGHDGELLLELQSMTNPFEEIGSLVDTPT
jgi:hypothetical protein